MRASMSQMTSGMSNLKGQMGQVRREGGMLDKQMKALKTTLRYTFAGSAVYGSAQMLQNFSQFSTRLGEISSIATVNRNGQGGMPMLNSQINELGQRILEVSNDTAQPIDDLQQGLLTLYSTIGDVPPNEAASMMEEISKVAVTSQSDIVSTTNALLGMIDAFGGGTDDIKKFGNEFYKVVKLSANMTGTVFAGQLGRLSASAAIGGFTPEQMNALAIAATRFGGSPSVNQMGLSQLMLSIMHPAGKEQEKVLAGIGLGQGQREKLKGWGTLMAFLKEVNRRGGVGMSGSLKNATDDTMNVLDENNLMGQAAGMGGGSGSALISKAFGRIQSQRMAAVLANLMTEQQVKGTPNQTISQYLDEVSKKADVVDSRMAQAMDYKRIQQAANSMHNFGIEMGTALSPLLNPAAKGITSATGKFGKLTPNEQLAVLAGTVGAGAVAYRSMGAASRMRGLRGLGMAQAGISEITGDASILGATPSNPMFVAVVYSLSGAGGGMFGGKVKTGAGIAAEAEIAGAGNAERLAAGAGGSTMLSRIMARRPGATVGRGVLKAGGVAMTLAMVDQIIQQSSWGFHPSKFDEGVDPRDFFSTDVVGRQKAHQRTHDYAALRAFTRTHAKGGIWNHIKGGFVNERTHDIKATKAEQKVLDAFNSGRISGVTANRMLKQLATPSQAQQGHFNRLAPTQVVGKATVDVTIHDEQGKKKGAAKVTMDLNPLFTLPAPQTRAKPKTHRSN